MTIPSSVTYFRSGAAAAIVAVAGILTAQIALDPSPGAEGAAGIIGLYASFEFRLQSVVLLIQVMAMFLALVSLAVTALRSSPGTAITGLSLLVIWQVLELCPRSIDYFVYSMHYAENYVAGNVSAELVENEFRRWFAWSDGIRQARLIAWAGALGFLGIALLCTGGLARIVGILLLFNSARVVAVFTAGVLEFRLPLDRELFIVINIPNFVFAAVLLWREARRSTKAIPERSRAAVPGR